MTHNWLSSLVPDSTEANVDSSWTEREDSEWSQCLLLGPWKGELSFSKLSLLHLSSHQLVLLFNTGISNLIYWDCHQTIGEKKIT